MKSSLAKRLWLIYSIIVAFLSFIDTAVYWSMKSIWFFIDKAIAGALGGSFPGAFVFFILFMASFVYSLMLLMKCKKEQKSDSRHVPVIRIILSALLILIFSAIDIYLYGQLGSEQNIITRNLMTALPWLIIVLGILFLIIPYPRLKISSMKGFKYGAAIILMLGIVFYLSGPVGVRITSGPVIQFVDESSLAVIWTTNRNSTGYVEYGSDENSLKRVSASHNGILDANTTVHKVILPVAHGSEFVYRVGSAKINQYYENSVEYGNTVVSSFRNYKDYRLNDTITFYVLNDIHENVDLYKDFLAGEDYDFLVLNGDLLNSADSSDVITNVLLKPVSECTEGIRPYYLVRGNHETRGASAKDLTDYIALPQDSYYYTFTAGPLYAVVLDSGEDKLDSHEEYSGLADFENYLGDETTWLQALSESDAFKSAKYQIAFVHMPLNVYEDESESSYLKANQQKWRDILNGITVDAVFSGHTHSSGVINKDQIGSTFDIYIGGGDSQKENEFLAIKVEVSEDSMKIYYINTTGEIVKEYEVQGNTY